MNITRKLRSSKLGFGLSCIFLLSSTASVIRWPRLPQQTTATATAFSLASIFHPKRTEQTVKNNYIDDPFGNSDNHSNNANGRKDHEKENSGGSSTTIAERPPFFPVQEQQNGATTKSNDSSSEKTESVHLQLRSMGTTTTTTVEEAQPPKKPKNNNDKEAPKVTRVRVHTYKDPKTKKKWMGLNTSRRKFVAFLEYNNATDIRVKDYERTKGRITTTTVTLTENGSCSSSNSHHDSSSSSSSSSECKYRNEWRSLWKSRQLLTERTELLAVYQSDSNNNKEGTSDSDSNNLAVPKKSRRGGFTDLLNLYTRRLVAILSDEQQDEQTPLDARYRSELTPAHLTNRYGQSIRDAETYMSRQSDHRILVKWLEDNYGRSQTQMLQSRRFHSLPISAQMELMQHFMDWFRSQFPYYYDRCDACGASRKDDLASQPPPQASDNTCNSGGASSMGDGDEDEDDDNGTFLGYIYPSDIEVLGKASRTELYHCHKCGSFTRFPRFNSAFDIVQSKRGRCGEYSLLLYRFLRALNHDCRWVVDWADHVWAEILIGDTNGTTMKPTSSVKSIGINGSSSEQQQKHSRNLPRWIHLDPCEAAVDKPLLYEEWGKKQTYIIALYAPLRYQTMQSQYHGHNGYETYNSNGFDGLVKASLVEDVTQQYTTDSWEEICKRRDESEEEVVSAIQGAIAELESKLLKSEQLTSQWRSTNKTPR